MNVKYLPGGWLDVESLMDEVNGVKYPFTFITGGRGIGKTYGILKYLIVNKIKFIFMRRTQAELEFLAGNSTANPFNALNRDLDLEITVKSDGKYLYRVLNDTGELMGVMVALSTIANLRGFDASFADFLFFDEFISERSRVVIRDEHIAFLNAVETIARNRELQGREPLRCVLAANSNRLNNPYYIGLNFLPYIIKMVKSGREITLVPERRICLVNIIHSPVSEAKAKTSLYQMAGEGAFTDMSIGNVYMDANDIRYIKPQNLKEFKPIGSIGSICIYAHKSKMLYYVTEHISGAVEVTPLNDEQLTLFRIRYTPVFTAYLNGYVLFETEAVNVMFRAYMKKA